MVKVGEPDNIDAHAKIPGLFLNMLCPTPYILFYFISFYFILFYFILFYFISFYFILFFYVFI